MNTKKVDITSGPLFYRSMLEAWQAVTVRRDDSSYSLKMFLNEPIFLNPIFKEVRGDRNFMHNFIDAGYTKVKRFRTLFPINGSQLPRSLWPQEFGPFESQGEFSL